MDQLISQSDSKMNSKKKRRLDNSKKKKRLDNSKKKKRLDKYIDKKLKKEERLVILEKLSRSQVELARPSAVPERPATAHKACRKSTQTAFSRWKEASSKQEIQAHDSETSFDSSDSASDPEDIDEESRHEEDGGFNLEAPKGQAGADPSPKRKRPGLRGPLGEIVHIPSSTLSQQLQTASRVKNSKPILVARPIEVEQARILLPIVAEEQPIMEAILLNPVVIICGETGSGKTTQVPQFLYEAGFGNAGSENPGMIGITQPRRVAAVSMATRVAYELSLTSSRVSYQIRYDGTVSPTTSIKFMTDGVLLRELAADFLLTKYSVIIIDEAHERSMNTDILIGVVSRVLKLREEMYKQGKEGIKPLRLVIMSATLRVSDFAENKTLFAVTPPIINVSARQHPVTIHFTRKTTPDYVTAAVKKACQIHARLPPGGILIFLTGQNEIAGVCRNLERKYGLKALNEKRRQRQRQYEVMSSPAHELQLPRPVPPAHADVEAEDLELGHTEHEDFSLAGEHDDDDRLGSPDSGDEKELHEELGIDTDESDFPMHIVSLYSLLPSEQQMAVFRPPPSGSRLVVVSTNIAETSLTIPGIRYVIDCGRAKERRYDVANGIQSFQITWISKASATQRAGRAGRTGPGHCYRLYSSALFEHHFDPFLKPEILRMPIEGVVLQMKSMHIDAVVNFPFPTPPDRVALRKAESSLRNLGALSPPLPVIHSSRDGPQVLDGATVGGQITELGWAMSLFPLSPRFSRILVGGRQHGCLPYTISIVAALSVGDPFLREEILDDNEEFWGQSIPFNDNIAVNTDEVRRTRRKMFYQSLQMHGGLGNFTSDIFRMLSAVGGYEYVGGGHKYCLENFVRPKAMEEIHKLRTQISNIVEASFPGVDTGLGAKLNPPNDLQLKMLRQLLTAGFIDQVAVRKDLVHRDASSGIKFANTSGVPYRAVGITEDVFVHPSSVLANVQPPDWIVFHEITQASKIWMKGLTIINPAWLASLGKGTLCSFSKPTKNKEGLTVSTPRFGPEEWELPSIKVQS